MISEFRNDAIIAGQVVPSDVVVLFLEGGSDTPAGAPSAAGAAGRRTAAGYRREHLVTVGSIVGEGTGHA